MLKAQKGIAAVCFAAFTVLAVACGGGSTETSTEEAPGASPATAQDDGENSNGACSLLTKEQVESALGTGELSAVTDSEFECAYGSEDEEAQVTFSTGIPIGGLESYEEDLARFPETLGEESVRILSGIGQAGIIVDNGEGGGFFASVLGEGGNNFSIYIYPLVRYKGSKIVTDISDEELYVAAEEMLVIVAPKV